MLTRIRGRLALAALSVLLVAQALGLPAQGGPFSFYAVYQRAAGPDSLGFSEISNSAMSGDGRQLVLYGRSRETGQLALVTMASDGSGASHVPIPEGLDALWDVTVSRDGSRAFFRHHRDRAIYKLERGTLAKVFDADAFGQVGGVDQVQTTADGHWVYFLAPRSSIWRVSDRGGAPERVVLDADVPRVDLPRTGGKPANISTFRVSADGSTIAFVLNAYWDAQGVFREKQEVFALHDGAIRQLTNDPPPVYKTQLALSRDGTTVAYAAGGIAPAWMVVATDGGAPRKLADMRNAGPVALDGDGSHVVWYDDLSNGGKLMRTDGTGGVDLFPRYNVGAIALNAPWSLVMSDSGQRISFRSAGGVYVGHFGRPDAVASAPVIHEIAFEPPVVDARTAAIGTTVRARITDPDGGKDIVRTSTNELVDGATVRDSRQAPIFFYQPINDTGAPPDPDAGDSVFSAGGQPGGLPGAVAATRVRLAVLDAAGSVVLADAGLSGGSGIAAGSGVLAGMADVGPTLAGAQAGTATPAGAPPGAVTPAGVPSAAAAAAVQSPAAGTKAGASEWSLPERAPLGGERATVQARLGWPDFFTFVVEPGPDGRMQRVETWSYSRYWTAFHFVGDRLLDSEEIDMPAGAFVSPGWYRPTHFAPGMTIAEVRQLLGDDLSEAEVPEDFGAGLRLFAGDQILLGFSSDGGLEYVETVGVASGRREP